jgi:radical SAM protein with 4Fe4S-binding SPASM domain
MNLKRIKTYLDIFMNNKSDFPSNKWMDYYDTRVIEKKIYPCHAPFNNMYFNSQGQVANCWLTFDNPEYYSEGKTLKEIWDGQNFIQLRKNIKKFDLNKSCETCLKNLKNGNYTNVLAKAYDNDFPIVDFPSMMEFELSNTCNLECTMCTGLLSSAIRANRDKLPKLQNPYGYKFVKELEEFIPYLHEARFNGGEPFLIKIYFDIWDRIISLNPKCKIVIATNGTILNERIKALLTKGNFHINLSIDSLIPEKYAVIRKNGNLEQVFDNLVFFKEYCLTNKRNLCIMINPMRDNWEELPLFVEFCNFHGVHLWFNTIVYPIELAIHSLELNQLKQIYIVLSKVQFEKGKCSDFVFNHNIKLFDNFVNIQLKNWMKEKSISP